MYKEKLIHIYKKSKKIIDSSYRTYVLTLLSGFLIIQFFVIYYFLPSINSSNNAITIYFIVKLFTNLLLGLFIITTFYNEKYTFILFLNLYMVFFTLIISITDIIFCIVLIFVTNDSDDKILSSIVLYICNFIISLLILLKLGKLLRRYLYQLILKIPKEYIDNYNKLFMSYFNGEENQNEKTEDNNINDI